jgi:branched-chain amino acid transport system permease protein
MQYFMQLLISGLAIGAIYGLIAMGFAVIYKSTGLVNFAQGEMTMITAYIAWTISTTVSGNVFVVALGAILAAVVLGLIIERVVMRPMLGEPVVRHRDGDHWPCGHSALVDQFHLGRLPARP